MSKKVISFKIQKDFNSCLSEEAGGAEIQEKEEPWTEQKWLEGAYVSSSFCESLISQKEISESRGFPSPPPHIFQWFLWTSLTPVLFPSYYYLKGVRSWLEGIRHPRSF